MCRYISTKYDNKNLEFYFLDQIHLSRKIDVMGFLKDTGALSSQIYDKIDAIYVPPQEFDIIESTLKRKDS